MLVWEVESVSVSVSVMINGDPGCNLTESAIRTRRWCNVMLKQAADC
jgi:hypothetical protein